MAVEVLVNTEDITVLGPPPTINVQLDIGATGVRGSRIFIGAGNPNSLTVNGIIFNQTLYLGDLYINNAISDEYSYMYQYISSLGTNTWIPVLKVNPTIYSKNFLQTFTNGTTTINIPLTSITQTSGTPLTAENFSVQISASATNPIASSITGISLTGVSEDTLSIQIKGAEFNSGSWSNYSGNATIHLLITVVLNP